ncbi:MAG: 50S ribosomal protein L21 [Rickettsiales bacterium]|jgi:large subunit ribosomal protein L21|nr:50S ribosomal protein L21 [Rickettsiales bacterium]
MFAIFKSGGKQYKVEVGETLSVERLDAKGAVEFAEVLMMDGKVGSPTVAGAKVKAKVVAHDRADKIIVFKKKRRQNYRRKQGHRQLRTVVKITDIIGG